jgi:hypothetical protein
MREEVSLRVRAWVREKDSGMKCSKCKAGGMYRVKREGLLHRRVYPLFGYYPWKCRQCEKIGMKKSRREGRTADRESEPE